MSNLPKTAIRIDYSNICKNYNTMYLDRDNNDPDTTACMNAALRWLNALLEAVLAHFEYQLYPLSSANAVLIKEVAAKRFMFYSLEKEITLQSFTLAPTPHTYNNSEQWIQEATKGMLLSNDEEGTCVTFYCIKESDESHYLLQTLQDFTLEQYDL